MQEQSKRSKQSISAKKYWETITKEERSKFYAIRSKAYDMMSEETKQRLAEFRRANLLTAWMLLRETVPHKEYIKMNRSERTRKAWDLLREQNEKLNRKDAS